MRENCLRVNSTHLRVREVSRMAPFYAAAAAYADRGMFATPRAMLLFREDAAYDMARGADWSSSPSFLIICHVCCCYLMPASFMRKDKERICARCYVREAHDIMHLPLPLEAFIAIFAIMPCALCAIHDWRGLAEGCQFYILSQTFFLSFSASAFLHLPFARCHSADAAILFSCARCPRHIIFDDAIISRCLCRRHWYFAISFPHLPPTSSTSREASPPLRRRERKRGRPWGHDKRVCLRAYIRGEPNYYFGLFFCLLAIALHTYYIYILLHIYYILIQ